MDSIQIPWQGWELIEKIGRGQFGTVYKISCSKYGITEYAAMKVISIPNDPQMIETDYSYGYDKESISVKYKSFLDDVIKEFQLMMTLKGNPNIVRCDDVYVSQHEDGIGWDVYIRMEYLSPLLMNRDLSVNCDEVVKMGMDLLNALIECEQNNIIHRDIKPSNIMVSSRGDYKLGDFGVSRTLESENTYGTKGIGTYDYMAPEIYNGGKYGKEADIYSLGMVLYWLLNDKTFPFFPKGKAPTVQQITEARDKRFRGEEFPSPVNGSDELKRIVLKACEFDPANRYKTAQEMMDDLVKLKYSEKPSETSVESADEPKTPESVGVDYIPKATESVARWEDTEATVGKQYKTPEDADYSQTVGKTYNTPVQPNSTVRNDNGVKYISRPSNTNKKKNSDLPIIIAVIAIVVIGMLAISIIPIVINQINKTSERTRNTYTDDEDTDESDDSSIESLTTTEISRFENPGSITIIGSETNGYIDLTMGTWELGPNNGSTAELLVAPQNQVINTDMSSTITMCTYDIEADPEDMGMRALEAMEEYGATETRIANVTVGGYTASRVYGIGTDGKYVVIWYFRTDVDDYLHYIETIFPESDHYILSMIENNFCMD